MGGSDGSGGARHSRLSHRSHRGRSGLAGGARRRSPSLRMIRTRALRRRRKQRRGCASSASSTCPSSSHGSGKTGRAGRSRSPRRARGSCWRGSRPGARTLGRRGGLGGRGSGGEDGSLRSTRLSLEVRLQPQLLLRNLDHKPAHHIHLRAPQLRHQREEGEGLRHGVGQVEGGVQGGHSRRLRRPYRYARQDTRRKLRRLQLVQERVVPGLKQSRSELPAAEAWHRPLGVARRPERRVRRAHAGGSASDQAHQLGRRAAQGMASASSGTAGRGRPCAAAAAACTTWPRYLLSISSFVILSKLW